MKYYIYTVKPVLRGHLWDKEKVRLNPYEKLSMTGQEKGDLLIQVTACAVLSVYYEQKYILAFKSCV